MAAPAPDTLSVDTPEDLEAAKFMALQIANSNAIMNVPEFNPIGLKGKRIITSGMGKAGQIAQLAASLLASNGVTSHFIHPADAQHGELGRIEKTDTLLLFSNSGETRELIELCELTENEKYVVTSNPQSTLAQMCVPILTGNPLEVCPLGLTPSTSLSTMLLITQHILFSITEINRIEYGKLHHGGYLGQKSR
jgi:arabinose-5-phosphate isomerase